MKREAAVSSTLGNGVDMTKEIGNEVQTRHAYGLET